MQSNFINIAIIQHKVSKSKLSNLQKAETMLRSACSNSSVDIAILPEMFNTPLDKTYFKEFAENVEDIKDQQKSPSLHFMKRISQELGIFLVGGSIPEEDGGKLYNTCFVFSPEGNVVAVHRKMHLFDVDMPGMCHKVK